MHKITLTIVLFFSLLLSSCEKEVSNDYDFTFIGDSLVAGWDVSKDFPSWNTHNLGVNGAQIDYIESLANKCTGKQVVILIGTNDCLKMLSADERESYSEEYISALDALNAKHIYLISVLPRAARTTYLKEDINHYIQEFNTLIRKKIANNPLYTYIDAYPYFLNSGELNENLYLDGLHLNWEGYKILTNSVKMAVVDNYRNY